MLRCRTLELFERPYNSLAVALFALVCCTALPSSADGQGPKSPLRLSPGESVSGADHPEQFSRYLAFHTMLVVLSVTPEDALNLQRRARTIMTNQIGLTASDMVAMEKIVEGFRTQETTFDAEVRQARSSGASRQDLAAISLLRHHLIAQTARQTHKTLSADGNKAIAAYLSRIISKSTIRYPRLGMSYGGGTK